MKVVFCLWLFLQVLGLAEEVRAYRAGVSTLRDAHQEVGGDHVGNYGEDDWLGEEVKEAPFKSRFLKKGNLWRDCSIRVKQLFAGEKVELAAIYDVEEKQLVVKADEMAHLMLAEILEEHLIYEMSTEVAFMSKKVGEQDELLAVISCLHLQGQEYEARSKDGSFVIRGESQWSSGSFYVESRVEWKSESVGGEFELKTDLTTVREVPATMVLGATGGAKNLFAVVTQERVLTNGEKFEEWILKEEGGAFLRKERLADHARGFGQNLSQKEGVRRFEVPPGFMDFITTSGNPSVGDPDPFAADLPEEPKVRNLRLPYRGNHPALEGVSRYELYDVALLLRENGVGIRERDFAFYKANQSVLLVKAGGIDLELVDGIVQSYIGEDHPKMVRLNFRKIEADGSIDQERLKSQDYVMHKMMGLEVQPGQVGTIKLGKDLILEAEGQLDHWSKLVEVRAVLSEEEQDLAAASFKTTMTLAEGVPVVVQQVRKGDRWLAWVVTAEIVVVGVNQENSER